MSTEQEILKSCNTVAVVGISSDENRPSHRVSKYLQEQGYQIIPVNPKESIVLGKTCYPDLKSIPEKVDVVDIFRRSEDVPAIIDQAIEIGAGAVWMQEGIKHEQAAEKARQAGLKVVQDRCMLKEHRLLNS
jgi:predicted CoA-binding protein